MRFPTDCYRWVFLYRTDFYSIVYAIVTGDFRPAQDELVYSEDCSPPKGSARSSPVRSTGLGPTAGHGDGRHKYRNNPWTRYPNNAVLHGARPFIIANDPAAQAGLALWQSWYNHRVYGCPPVFSRPARTEIWKVTLGERSRTNKGYKSAASGQRSRKTKAVATVKFLWSISTITR